MIWRIGLLVLGAVLLLVASAAIIVGARRGTPVTPASANAIGPTPTIASPATATNAPATATGVLTTPPTVAPSGPQATATRATVATPTLPTVANSGCAMGLPDGYEADPAQVGYFPARDRTGFVALDAFVGADRTPAALAQSFANDTLSRVLTDYQQTGATDLGDRYRIDYRATADGKSGRGSTQVQVFGELGCGVTVFALDGATRSPAATFDLLVRSLLPVGAPRIGPATATP